MKENKYTDSDREWLLFNGTLNAIKNDYIGANHVPTPPACTWWNRPEEDHSSGKLESTYPSRSNVKSIKVLDSAECGSVDGHRGSEDYQY